MSDISGIIQHTGVKLEAKAFSTFGAAVQNQVGGVLSTILSQHPKITAPVSSELAADLNAAKHPAVWDPTPYASAFASGAGGFDPKTKFLFKVTIMFSPEAAEKISRVTGIPSDGRLASSLTFAIKQIDMPKYKFEYEEVNMYNFRTNILKRVIHDDLSFQMYDTTGNHAINFINAYLQLIKPSARQSYTLGFDMWDHGFAFTDNPTDGSDTGSRDSLLLATNALASVTIDQYYLSRDHSENLHGTSIVNAIKVNSFEFSNPKITHFEISDQDHEQGSTPAMITCGFNYDTIFIKTGQSGVDVNNAGPRQHNDILSNVVPGDATVFRGTQVGAGGGSNNPFIDVIARQASRTIRQSIGDVIAKSGITNIPGTGRVISQVSGLVGLNAEKTISSIGNVAPGISIFTQPTIVDNSVPRSQAADLSSQTSSTPPGVLV